MKQIFDCIDAAGWTETGFFLFIVTVTVLLAIRVIKKWKD